MKRYRSGYWHVNNNNVAVMSFVDWLQTVNRDTAEPWKEYNGQYSELPVPKLLSFRDVVLINNFRRT